MYFCATMFVAIYDHLNGQTYCKPFEFFQEKKSCFNEFMMVFIALPGIKGLSPLLL